MVKVEFKKLYGDSILPRKAHESDAGFDLFAHSVFIWYDGRLVELERNDNDKWILACGDQLLVKVGFGMSIPIGYEAQIRPRSGLALKHKVSVANSPGTIDSGFRDEVGVILMTTGQTGGFEFGQCDRVAQMVIQKLPKIEAVEVDNLTDPSERGAAGFGSTGR